MANKNHIYISGYISPQAKKIAQFVFGENLFKFEVHEKDRIFDVWVYENSDDELIKEFEDFFGCFRVTKVKVE
jgi:hypothetical protein